MKLSALVFFFASVLAAGPCVVQEIGVNTAVTGALSASDCRARSLIAGSANGAYVRQYNITLTERGILTILYKSTAFDAYLRLLDSQGRLVAFDNDSGGETNARIAIHLNAGVYTAWATSWVVATGAYTFETRFETPRTCATLDLMPGQAMQAELSSSDCRAIDLQLQSRDETYLDQYRIQVDRQAVLTVLLKSTQIDGYLRLLNSTGRVVAVDDDSGGRNNARIVVQLAPGTYTIRASSHRVETGAYTLEAGLEDPRACVTQDLDPGQTVQGDLAGSDCRGLDLLNGSSDATLMDEYRVQLPDRGVLTVRMNSRDFDTLLTLLDGRRRVIAWDDDGGSGTNSKLTAGLLAGTYYIRAGSFDVAAGAYSLETSVENLRPCTAADLPVDGWVHGELSPGDCRVLDLEPPSDDPTYLDPYQIQVPRRGVLRIDLMSASFDTVMVLMDGVGDPVADDDDGGERTNSRLELLLDPGLYTLYAASWDNRPGAYHLETRFRDPRDCPARDIGVGATVDGALSGADCRLRDLLARETSDGRAAVYRVNVTQAGTLSVALSSQAFLPLAIVVGPNNQVLGKGLQVSTRVSPGVYTILAATSSVDIGAYTLAISFQ